MNSKFDYNAIMVFPYTVFAMLLSALFIMLSLSAYSVLLVSGTVTLNQMMNGAYVVCYFLRYLAIVSVFICLYRLANRSKWFNLSCYMCELYMVAELISRVVKWLATTLGDHPVINILAMLVNFIPSLFIVMIIVFLINGMNELYIFMGDEKNAERIKKIKPLWIFAEISQMLVSAILTPIIYLLKGMKGYAVAWSILGAVILLYVFICLDLYKKMKRFCYEYYMFNYNNQNAI